MLKPFDRIQIVKESEKAIYEYIVTEVVVELNKVTTLKLSKIDIATCKQYLFGYDISSKEIEQTLALLTNQIATKFVDLEKQIDEKVQAAISLYLEEADEE